MKGIDMRKVILTSTTFLAENAITTGAKQSNFGCFQPHSAVLDQF
jgi:hypothetical protein